MRNFFLFLPLGLVALILPDSMLSQQGDRRDGRSSDRRFTTDEAIQSCKDSIQQEAHGRFGAANIVFRETSIDNNPGRNDWVNGSIAVKTSRWRPREVYRFSCSVDFASGRLRTAHIGVPNY